MGSAEHTEGDDALRRRDEMGRLLRGAPFLPQLLAWYTLQEHERDNLVAPCHRWADHFSDDKKKALIAAIRGAFKKWQLRQVDAEGRVQVSAAPGGLLSYLVPDALVPHKQAAPWQCAGPFVRNDIDLAFKLWLDDDPDFAAVLAAHSWEEVFAIIGLLSGRTAGPSSLIRLNASLVMMLINEVNAGKRQTNTNLAKAREVARREKKRKSAELRQSLRTAAFDYWCAHLVADKGVVIAFLRSKAGGNFGHVAASTIARLIAGVYREVRAALKSSPEPRTDLYATTQKRKA